MTREKWLRLASWASWFAGLVTGVGIVVATQSGFEPPRLPVAILLFGTVVGGFVLQHVADRERECRTNPGAIDEATEVRVANTRTRLELLRKRAIAMLITGFVFFVISIWVVVGDLDDFGFSSVGIVLIIHGVTTIVHLSVSRYALEHSKGRASESASH